MNLDDDERLKRSAFLLVFFLKFSSCATVRVSVPSVFGLCTCEAKQSEQRNFVSNVKKRMIIDLVRRYLNGIVVLLKEWSVLGHTQQQLEWAALFVGVIILPVAILLFLRHVARLVTGRVSAGPSESDTHAMHSWAERFRSIDDELVRAVAVSRPEPEPELAPVADVATVARKSTPKRAAAGSARKSQPAEEAEEAAVVVTPVAIKAPRRVASERKTRAKEQLPPAEQTPALEEAKTEKAATSPKKRIESPEVRLAAPRASVGGRTPTVRTGKKKVWQIVARLDFSFALKE